MKSVFDILRLVLLALLFGGGAGALRLSAATTHYVYIRDIAFNPYDLTIAAGDTVVWVCEESTHTVSPSGGTGDAFCGTGYLFDGDNCSATFNTAGEFRYRCLVHSGFFLAMNGVIRVTALPNNVLPTISILQPANLQEIGAFFTFQVDAADSDGTVKMVEFFYGADAVSGATNFLGMVTNSTLLTNSLYELTVTNGLPHGDYQLAARVTDDRGGIKTAGLAVTILPQLTGPELITLTNGEPARRFVFSTTLGSNYIVQTATNLTPTGSNIVWVSFYTNRATNNPFTLTLTNPLTNFPNRFYRVLQAP